MLGQVRAANGPPLPLAGRMRGLCKPPRFHPLPPLPHPGLHIRGEAPIPVYKSRKRKLADTDSTSAKFAGDIRALVILPLCIAKRLPTLARLFHEFQSFRWLSSNAFTHVEVCRPCAALLLITVSMIVRVVQDRAH